MAASTKDCISICEVTSQCPGGVKDRLELENKFLNTLKYICGGADLLPGMYCQQTSRKSLSCCLPFHIDARYATFLDAELIISPIQSKCNIQQFAGEYDKLVDREWVAKCSGGRGG